MGIWALKLLREDVCGFSALDFKAADYGNHSHRYPKISRAEPSVSLPGVFLEA